MEHSGDGQEICNSSSLDKDRKGALFYFENTAPWICIRSGFLYYMRWIGIICFLILITLRAILVCISFPCQDMGSWNFRLFILHKFWYSFSKTQAQVAWSYLTLADFCILFDVGSFDVTGGLGHGAGWLRLCLAKMSTRIPCRVWFGESNTIWFRLWCCRKS